MGFIHYLILIGNLSMNAAIFSLLDFESVSSFGSTRPSPQIRVISRLPLPAKDRPQSAMTGQGRRIFFYWRGE
jgi:hypothetical protein